MTSSQSNGKVFRDVPKGIQTSPTVVKFSTCIHNNLGAQCMATQDAIDRIVVRYRGREGFLALLCSAEYKRGDLYANLAEGAWSERDVALASGRSRDYWLGMIDGESRILHAVYADVDAVPMRVSP